MNITPAIQEDLRRIVWDYDIDEATLTAVFMGRTRTFSLTREKLCSRLLISTPWYRLLAHFGIQGLREILTDEAIRQIWISDVRDKFFYAKDALQRIH